MSVKVKTITLLYGVPDRDVDGKFNYIVEKVTDSTEFAPRSILKKEKVDELCAARDWKVIITGVK